MEAAQRRRILIVEDSVDAAAALGEILVLWGHEVVVAHDGQTALDAAAKNAPDSVLLDIGLPGMDGYEVARALRKVGADWRIVALSGYGQGEDQRRSRDAGFDRHLVKPVKMELLKAALAVAARADRQVV